MSENLNEIEAPACPECNENYTYEMGELWACPMCGHEWERTAAGETEEEAGSKVLDSVGNELVDGDSVTIVKGLKVKGGADIKAGTKVRGIRGRSSREGTYYSLAWFLGMPLSALILSRVNAFLADLNTSQANEVASVVSNALPCLVVGVIFLMSAALWNEVVMGVLGGWILLVTLVVTIVGMPWAWWIMSVAGGGGMLVAAVVAAAAESKRGA